MAEDSDIGFEDGLSWLPTVVLDEACHFQEYLKKDRHQQHCHPLKSATEPLPPLSKSSLKPNHRPRYPANWASGGPGMQAIFLESGQKSCGTGVFLPRRAGTDLPPSKKPACSPVLLPSRVVQALNLNVHALGLHVTPHRDSNNKLGGEPNCRRNENMKNDSTKCCVISQSQSSSPEIFLPKEWSY